MAQEISKTVFDWLDERPFIAILLLIVLLPLVIPLLGVIAYVILFTDYVESVIEKSMLPDKIRDGRRRLKNAWQALTESEMKKTAELERMPQQKTRSKTIRSNPPQGAIN